MYSRAFSLIELMVVIAIMSTLMAIVGPLAINSLEKADAKQEIITLKKWGDAISQRAFLSHQKMTLELKGRQATLLSGDNEVIQKKEFDVLFFQPQTITFSRNGFSKTSSIEYQRGESKFIVPLTLGAIQ